MTLEAPLAACRAVSFDACGTLLRSQPEPAEALVLACRAMGCELDAAEARSFHEQVRGRYTRLVLRAQSAGRKLAGDQRHEAWRRIFNRAWRVQFKGQAAADKMADPAHAVEAELAQVTFSLKAAPGAQHVLKAIRASGRRTGVVSNFDESLARVLERAGLAPYLDAVIASAAVGFEKPDPRIFRALLQALGVTAGDAVHVGDHPFDIIGAAAAGMQPVLLGPGTRRPSPSAPPYLVIRQLCDLPPLLGLPPL